MQKKRFLVIGSGGRENAIAYALSQSQYCEKLYIAPGNPGTASLGENVSVSILSPTEVLDFCQHYSVDIVVVGPEAPLMEGLADVLTQNQIATIGPSSSGARLEGSKAFAKKFMQQYNIPTASYQVFEKSQVSQAKAYLRSVRFPVVIKASGLAAGKGVIICEDLAYAEKVVEQMMNGNLLGNAGETIVIEEFLHGWEVSMFILTDGKNYLLLPEAKDYKRVGEGNTGPNTGGMGSVSPVHLLTPELKQKILHQVIEPTLKGLQKENITYVGFIFFGLMIAEGEPYVLEYNVRMGDPETQSVFTRIVSDVGEMFILTAEQKLSDYELKVSPQTAVTLVLASEGYPGEYEKDKIIYLPRALTQDVRIYHAGTKNVEDQLLTNGGRVLNITALGDSLSDAIHKAYHFNEQVNFYKKYFRKDIGKDLLVLDSL